MWSDNQSFKNSPCLDCKERYIGCHAECVKYKDAKQKYEVIRAERNRDAELKNAISSMKCKQYNDVSYHQRRK